MEDAHALGVRLRLRCAAAQPCVGSRRAGCRSAKVNETQGGLRDAAEYSTGDAPAAAARRPLSAPACRGWARLRCGCAIGSPAWAVDAGGETTAGSCMQAPQTDPLLPSGRIPLAPAATGTSRQNAGTGGASVSRRAATPVVRPLRTSESAPMVPGPYPLVLLLLPPTYTRDDTSRTMPPPAAAVCHSELGELIS